MSYIDVIFCETMESIAFTCEEKGHSVNVTYRDITECREYLENDNNNSSRRMLHLR